MQALAVEVDGHPVVHRKVDKGGLPVPVSQEDPSACPGNNLHPLLVGRL